MARLRWFLNVGRFSRDRKGVISRLSNDAATMMLKAKHDGVLTKLKQVEL